MKRLPVTKSRRPSPFRSTSVDAWPCDQARVDHPARPLAALALLEPEDAVVVAGGGDDIVPAVAVDVDDVHEAELADARGRVGLGRRRGRGDGNVDGLPDRMERPVPCARIGRRLEPAARRQDVVALVAVDVARADAVAVGAIADDVRDPGLVLDFVPGLARAVLLREDFLRLAVVVEIDEQRELDVEAFVDRRLPSRIVLARQPALAGVAPPRHLLREPGDRHDVGIVVRVDVDHQVAEVVDVLVAEAELAEAVLRPVRRLIPVLARDDVEPPVAVDVGHRGRLAGAQVDRLDPERNIGRAAALP